MGRKHCGKGKNCLLQAISLFPTVFSKDLYCRPVKPGLVWERVKLHVDSGLPVSIHMSTKPHSSVGRVVDLRTGGRKFDPRLGQYSFGGLMIVTATGFIPLSQLSIVLTVVMWESSQWLGKNIVQSTG